MKRFAVQMIFVVAAVFFLSSCASSDPQFGESGSSSSTRPVPGEKAASGPDVMPAASGSTTGARVGW